MTEASENGYLVRVRAQVMCRDEGTGGWLALGGGGLADVMVGRRRHTLSGSDSSGDTCIAAAPAHEYFIHGKRISDNMVVLECTIKKDFQYNKVMPTFHHWVTDEKRFGLTFQTAADARAFDKGVRTAVEELLDGVGGAWPSLHVYKQHNPAPKDDDEEQNIFECLDLPCSSRSSSENSSGCRARDPRDQTPILCPIALPEHRTESVKKLEAHYDEKLGVVEADPDRCPYVHLSAVHEYTYPSVVSSGERASPHTKPPPLASRPDPGDLKKSTYSASLSLPVKKTPTTYVARIRCQYCNSWYLESANRAGDCKYAPYCCQSCVDTVSCIKCAQCMVYHCMSDSEGDYSYRPCACAPPTRKCGKRWISLTLLSLFSPCLCFYGPLSCVQRVACKCEIAGRKHTPIQ